jgi:2-oxoglutarate dehydrogenase E1 component
LLPHGNEGQGPDHSSARPERFLELAAETNLRLANPTTAAQYFHVLRRQAALLVKDPLPLILLTPKGLLRHPLVASTPRELASGRWRPVLDDPLRREDAANVRRALLCSGRISVDLRTSELRDQAERVAVLRLEQLYPFPAEALYEALEGYPNLEELLWVQEEPRNMGAWRTIRPQLASMAAERWRLEYAGRSPSSSPAEGSSNWYRVNQEALVKAAFAEEAEPMAEGLAIEREGVDHAL